MRFNISDVMPDMPIPNGFEDLVRLAMKERPVKPKNTEEIWDKFLFIVFMGGKRSEPDINFIIKLLKSKKLLDMNYVIKASGEKWHQAVEKLINERLKRIKDEEIQLLLQEFLKELFRITASIKGGARFFEKNKINPKKLDDLLKDKETTWEFIENLAEDQDVPNIKYTKIILWLHSLGYAYDFSPPTWQIKQFINYEIGPYYQFYEDEKYFMKKAQELSEEIKNAVKGVTTRDVVTAIYFYISIKNMLPFRSPEKKKFTPAILITFLKKKKLSLKDVSENLSRYDGREEFMEKLYAYLRKE